MVQMETLLQRQMELVLWQLVVIQTQELYNLTASNSHGIKLQSPPHSSSQSYTESF